LAPSSAYSSLALNQPLTMTTFLCCSNGLSGHSHVVTWSSIIGDLINLLNITLTGYCLAFNDIIVKFDSTSWTIALLALLPALFLIGVIFRRTVGHCAKDLGVFSIIILCCCDVAEEVHKGLMRCLLRCSCSDASDSDTISEASSLPSYTVSLQHFLSSLFLFISHFRPHVLTKYLYMTTRNLMILFN